MSTNNIQDIIEDIADYLKSGLGLGSKSLVGLDIGYSAVKIVELKTEKRGKYNLLNYMFAPLPEGSIIEDEIQNQKVIIQTIQDAYEDGDFSTNQACLGLWGPNTMVRKLQLAGGSAEETEDQVIWEIEQYIPFDIEDSDISFDVIGENEGGGIDVIVAAVKKDLTLDFTDLVKRAKMRCKIVELVQTALVNVFELVAAEEISENRSSSWLLMDIGGQTTEFIVYKNNSISFSKQINVGGLMITEQIQREMGVNYQEAEDLKINGDEQGNLPEEIVAIIDIVSEQLFNEIKKTLDFYMSATSDETLVGCYVTGGTCQIVGLLEGLKSVLRLPVKLLNPLEIMTNNESEFDSEELSDITYRAVAAIGLGLRELGQ